MGINGAVIPALLYLGVNLVAACAFAWDKHRAQGNSWRTREGTLLGLALLGPFGALAAMLLFRHKTRKVKFLLVPVFLVLHLVLIIRIVWALSG